MKGRDMQLLPQWIDENTVHLTCTEPRCFHYIEIKMGEPVPMEDIVAWYDAHRFVTHEGENLTWPHSTSFSSFSPESVSSSEPSVTSLDASTSSVWD